MKSPFCLPNCEKIIFTEDGGLAAQLDSNATNNNGLVFARDDERPGRFGACGAVN